MDNNGIVVTAALALAVNMWSIPLFGVPLTVVGMSVLGAALGASYGDPIHDRVKLFKTITSHAFLAAVLVAVVPAALGWEWMHEKLEGPLAGGIAFLVPFAAPLVPWRELIRKVFRLENKKEVDNG